MLPHVEQHMYHRTKSFSLNPNWQIILCPQATGLEGFGILPKEAELRCTQACRAAEPAGTKRVHTPSQTAGPQVTQRTGLPPGNPGAPAMQLWKSRLAAQGRMCGRASGPAQAHVPRGWIPSPSGLLHSDEVPLSTSPHLAPSE